MTLRLKAQPSPGAAIASSSASTAAAGGIARAPAQAQASEPQLTSTQQRIQSLLSVDTVPSPGDAYMTLMKLEKRPLPDDLSLQQLHLQSNPTRSCCFDVANTYSSWAAHRVCERCRRVRELMIACSQSPLSSGGKTLLLGVFWATDCVSEERCAGLEQHTLPHELLDIVIEFAADEMRWNDNGTALAKLMHTSSSVRQKIVRPFEPIQVHERPIMKQRLSTHALRMPRCLVEYVWQSVDYYFLDSFARRRAAKPKFKAKEPITTTDGNWVTDVAFEIKVEASSSRTDTGRVNLPMETKTTKVTFISEEFDEEDQDLYHVSDVCQDLRKAFAKLGEPPRIVSPFQRALDADLRAPVAAVDIKIDMHFRLTRFEDHHPDDEYFHSWHFEAVDVRRALDL